MSDHDRGELIRGLRLAERWRFLPAIALAGALVLLLSGVFMGVANEASFRSGQARDAMVQADILAASVAAPLAFDDDRAAQEYVDALKASPSLAAVGVYNERGALVASLSRGRDAPPARAPRAQTATYGDGRVVAVTPVIQGSTHLGRVFLRTRRDPLTAILLRHTGVTLLAVMALMFVTVLGQAQATLRRANAELGERAGQLSEANRELKVQMDERERAEEALRQSQKMEAVGQLTGGVAHDFNNILMVASSGLDLLDRTTDPERRQMLKDGIRQAVDRGSSLTRQLLTISRRTALQPQVIEIGKQIEGMRMLLDRSLREDITVNVELDPDLWAVEADPSQLEVAILNVAVNARDAMPDGGTITIRGVNAPGLSEGDLEGDFVQLSIIDEGVGMSRETVRRVFEPFFTTKGVGKGTGLGLAQVYGFTRSSGGDVRIESEPGKGAAVQILLPRSTRGVPAPAKAALSPPEAAPAVRGSQGRLLLVEDEDSVATLVSEMLRELGYVVRRVSSAAAALRTIAAEPDFDLVFSDMVMPGRLSGLDLARELARLRPDLPVVLTTGFSEAAASAAEQGWRLLVKPYRMEALAATLEDACKDRGGAS